MKRLFLSIIVLGTLSCEKPILVEDKTLQRQQPQSEVVIREVNGTFAFETIDDFEATAKKVGSMNRQEYASWQKTYNIKTLYSEYLSLSSNVSLQDISKSRPRLIFFNHKSNSYELNSVNSNYAKITNDKGLVIINNACYQFSATEVKCIKGSDQGSINTLLNSVREEYQTKGIKFFAVEEGFKPRSNAKMGPWVKDQKGNGIYDMAGWDGAYYVKAKLQCRYYYIPNPWFPGMDSPRMAIELEGKYYRERGIGADQQRTPQQYSVTWSFELNEGMTYGTYIPYTGNYAESGIETFSRVFYDGYPRDVRNLNIPVIATDFNKNGATVTSTTTFVVTN